MRQTYDYARLVRENTQLKKQLAQSSPARVKELERELERVLKENEQLAADKQSLIHAYTTSYTELREAREEVKELKQAIQEAIHELGHS